MILEKIRARPENQGHAITFLEGQAGGGHCDIPRIGGGGVMIHREGAVLIEHEQLAFIFKAVAKFAHRVESVAFGGNLSLVHVRKLNAAGVGGGLVRR